jgi:hypothetical protein
MASKRQQTFAKMTRERAVKEKRALKQEKKQLLRDARAGKIPFPEEYLEKMEEGLDDGQEGGSTQPAAPDEAAPVASDDDLAPGAPPASSSV